MKNHNQYFLVTLIETIVDNIFLMIDKGKHKIYKKRLFRQGLKIGEHSYILAPSDIREPSNVCIGNNVHINDNVLLNAGYGKIIISDNVTISSYCKLLAAEYDIETWVNTGDRVHSTDNDIYIGKNVWLCAGVTILPKVKITGEFVIVAADSVVTHDITDSYIVVAGAPAKIIKHIR